MSGKTKKENASAFWDDFSETSLARDNFRKKIEAVYKTWRSENYPNRLSELATSAGPPVGLPLPDGGVLREWAQTTPYSFTGNQRIIFDFCGTLIAQGDELDSAMLQVAKFWDLYGVKVERNELRMSDIQRALPDNAWVLIVLSYWEPLRARENNTGVGVGKSGLFLMANEAVNLIDGEGMTSLKEAREQGKLEEFIRAHENDATGDLDKLDAALKRPSRESVKATRKASSQGSSDD